MFVKKCITSPYEKSFVKSGLGLLGGDYAKIAMQKKHQGKFTSTEENEMLAKFLKRNNFISTYENKNGIIKMNAKNV